MFWLLFLCHLVADYPLQTDGMVKAKRHLIGLLVHTGLHLATMLVIMVGIAGLDINIILVYLLAVTILHFSIDVSKNLLQRFYPNHIRQSYLLDQALHITTVWLIAYWYGISNATTFLAWPIYLSGYVLVSHTWFVTERVLSYKHLDYQNWVTKQMWSRMMSRIVLLAGLLLLLSLNLWGALAVLGALSLHIFDLAGYRKYRKRALLIDTSVTIATSLLIAMVLALH